MHPTAFLLKALVASASMASFAAAADDDDYKDFSVTCDRYCLIDNTQFYAHCPRVVGSTLGLWTKMDLESVVGFYSPSLAWSQDVDFSVNGHPCHDCHMVDYNLACQCDGPGGVVMAGLNLANQMGNIDGTLCVKTAVFGPVCAEFINDDTQKGSEEYHVFECPN